jgi:hypothetical protein
MLLLLLFLSIRIKKKKEQLRLDDRLISYFIYQSLRKETKEIYFDF